MDVKETAAVMAILKIAYPRYYANTTTAEAKETLNLWHTMLAEYPADMVNAAVKALIATNVYPPTIADVISSIKQLTQKKNMSEVVAWGLVKNAIRNSAYHSVEEFDKLPPEIQETVGSPMVLREWAMSDDESTETVIASNFMRSYKAKVKERKEFDAIPSDIKELLIKNTENMRLEMK